MESQTKNIKHDSQCHYSSCCSLSTTMSTSSSPLVSSSSASTPVVSAPVTPVVPAVVSAPSTIQSAIQSILLDLGALPTITTTNLFDLAKQAFDLAIAIDGLPTAQISPVLISVFLSIVSLQAPSLSPVELAALQQMITVTLPTVIADWQEAEAEVVSCCSSLWSKLFSCCS
jgi:hypothetical protein